jgi:hypothetical protein
VLGERVLEYDEVIVVFLGGSMFGALTAGDTAFIFGRCHGWESTEWSTS